MSVTISNANTTWDTSSDSTILSVVRDEDGSWIVSHHWTRVYGHGRSLLEAMCDFWAALGSHIAVMEDDPLSPQLARELVVMKRLREVSNQEKVPSDYSEPSVTQQASEDSP